MSNRGANNLRFNDRVRKANNYRESVFRVDVVGCELVATLK